MKEAMKLVPVEPTQKMLDAPPNSYPADALVTWKAMLAAAPQPAQRKPLTDEEMWSLWNSQGDAAMEQKAAITFARAIEAAHGIKENT